MTVKISRRRKEWKDGLKFDLSEVDVSLVCSYFSTMFKLSLSLGGVKSTEKLQFSFLFQTGNKNTK